MSVGSNEAGQRNVGSWTDITAIAGGAYHSVGLKSDGTVVAVGAVEDPMSTYDFGQLNVGSWSDIIAIATHGIHTAGLKSDGTVVAVGYNYNGQRNVESWSDIAQIAMGHRHTVGLKSDGTVVATGDNYYGQSDVESWTDIVYIAANGDHTLGLKNDGTVVAVGSNSGGKCNVGSWDFDNNADDDSDGIGDDGDGSGIIFDNPCTGGDTVSCDDNCPNVSNPDQADHDNDGIGDACGDNPDIDNDGLYNDVDNCPEDYNPNQHDADGNGEGDLCDYYGFVQGMHQKLEDCSCGSTTTTTVNPTLIELSALEAKPHNAKVSVSWSTDSEIDNVGFNIWRAEGFRRISDDMIPGEGGSTFGAAYEFIDNMVFNGKRYWYLLEDVDTEGISMFYGPVKAVPRKIYGVFE